LVLVLGSAHQILAEHMPEFVQKIGLGGISCVQSANWFGSFGGSDPAQWEGILDLFGGEHWTAPT
jgi:hypothetical protein